MESFILMTQTDLREQHFQCLYGHVCEWLPKWTKIWK